jgi:hypothetical protein
MQRKRETSETCLTLAQIKTSKRGDFRHASQTESRYNSPELTPIPTKRPDDVEASWLLIIVSLIVANDIRDSEQIMET